MARKSTPPPAESAVPSYQLEVVPLVQLRPHPRNYREHPEDQLQHIKHSLQMHGVYRNVVVARDYTLLAGHGVVEAARQIGMTHAPVKRLDVDPQDEEALQVLVGDNEVQRLTMNDDRALTELLKELKTADEALLLGTGFDAQMLAALTYVTRPASEVKDFDEAAHWVGMPEYQDAEETLKVVVSFRTAEDRAWFAERLGLEFTDSTRTTLSVWWPPKDREDLASLRFDGAA